MDYIPPQRSERNQFYKNFSDNAVTEGPKFNAPTGSALAAKANADAILAAMAATDSLEDQLKAARLIERNVIALNLPPFRATGGLWKKLPGWPASGSEAVLRLKGPGIVFDPATYKPSFTLSMEAGKIRFDFEKKGVQRLKFFCRLRGQTVWNEIGEDSAPPYWDTNPLANPNVPEVREYMARGVIDDEEIGVDSDIVTITFGG
jgi:hypothetical protein